MKPVLAKNQTKQVKPVALKLISTHRHDVCLVATAPEDSQNPYVYILGFGEECVYAEVGAKSRLEQLGYDTSWASWGENDEIKLYSPGLPPLPDGAVHLGRGGEFKTNGRFAGWAWSGSFAHWEFRDHWNGNLKNMHYAAPADTEIAKLNSIEPELPFGLSWGDPQFDGFNYITIDSNGAISKSINRPEHTDGVWDSSCWEIVNIPNTESLIWSRPKPACNAKIVEIDCKKYRLVPIGD